MHQSPQKGPKVQNNSATNKQKSSFLGVEVLRFMAKSYFSGYLRVNRRISSTHGGVSKVRRGGVKCDLAKDALNKALFLWLGGHRTPLLLSSSNLMFLPLCCLEKFK